MTSWASGLTTAPRGRHLCLATAVRLSDRVHTSWMQLSWHQGDHKNLTELVDALEAIDPAVVANWTDPLEFHLPLDSSVSAAMGWQPPNDMDFVAAFPALTPALQPIADAISASPAAAWWSMPLDLDTLRLTIRRDKTDARPRPELEGAATRLATWRTDETEENERARLERPKDVTAAFTGHWWSTPTPLLPTTTRALPGVGSVNLLWEEDSFGQRDAIVWPVRATRPPRIYEIDSPQAWTDLVARYPLDLTWSRRHDWYNVTHQDRRWCIPDWAAVGREFDAVHLTVLGYLTTATRLLELDDCSATLLAGWNPDQTWWLTDTLTTEREPERWTQTDGFGQPDDNWRQLAP
jgi:hypothetical protein